MSSRCTIGTIAAFLCALVAARGALLAAPPMCHGAGGLAAHVAFGARSGATVFTGQSESSSLLPRYAMWRAPALGPSRPLGRGRAVSTNAR